MNDILSVTARLIVGGRGRLALLIAAPSLTLSAQHIDEDSMIARSGISQVGLIVAAALSIAVFSTAARAYTPEEEQACSGDAMRLCGAYIPDVDRITACMIQLRDQLSPGCRVFFRGPEPTPVAANKPMVIKPRKAISKASKARKPHKTS
jgi:hypothetical protein